MKRAKAAAFAGALTGALVLTAAPANAHNSIVFHGSDWAAVNVAHNTITVRDGECDSNYVEAEFYYRSYSGGPVTWDHVIDGNGCPAGENVRNRYQITSYRVCETNISGAGSDCTGWRTT